VNHNDGFDLVSRVSGQARFQFVFGRTTAPVTRHVVHENAQPLGDVLPLQREMPGFEDDDAIAGRERVHVRRLRRAGSRPGIDDDGIVRFEHTLEPGDQFQRERRELRTAVVDGRPRHGAQHAIGNVRGTGDLKKMPTGLGHIVIL